MDFPNLWNGLQVVFAICGIRTLLAYNRLRVFHLSQCYKLVQIVYKYLWFQIILLGIIMSSGNGKY